MANRSRGPMLHGSRVWTDDEIETLRINWADWPSSLIGALLHRSPTAVSTKAHQLKLSKAPDFAAKMEVLKKLLDLPLGDRFKVGQVPHNKGVRRPGWSPGRMSQTQFKKGRPAHEAKNYKPIGALRISKDGYVERKVSDDPALAPARRWVAVHRLVWIENNGDIPKGHAVTFKPGRFTTDLGLIVPEVLELVSRQELMRRNSVHTRFPPEVVNIIQLRGALNRKINRRCRDEKQDV